MNPNPLAFLQILNGYNRPEKATLVKVTLNIPARDAVAESWSGRDMQPGISPFLPRQ